MFREMNKLDRKIDIDEMTIILKSGEYGILSTINKNGFPYGVPVNYIYNNHCIYISTIDGNKVDNVKFNNKVSFCIVEKAPELSDEYSTYYESVIIYGYARVIDGEEREKALALISNKYANKRMEKEKENAIVLKINVEHETGKLRKKQ